MHAGKTKDADVLTEHVRAGAEAPGRPPTEVERFVTVRDKGIRQQLLSATMYELPFDFFLQATHAKAYADAIARTERTW